MKFLFVTQKRLVLRIQAKKKQKSTEQAHAPATLLCMRSMAFPKTR